MIGIKNGKTIFSSFALQCPKCYIQGIIFEENFRVIPLKRGFLGHTFGVLIKCRKCGYEEFWNQDEGYYISDGKKYLAHMKYSQKGFNKIMDNYIYGIPIGEEIDKIMDRLSKKKKKRIVSKYKPSRRGKG